jgi:hypothetical protein
MALGSAGGAAMNVEQRLIEHWRENQTLSALVPSPQLFVGAAVDRPAAPYAVISIEKSTTDAHSSGGESTRTTSVDVSLRAFDLDELPPIEAALRNCYEGAEFDLDDGAAFDMRLEEQRRRLSPDGVWESINRFTILSRHTLPGA